MRKRDIVGWTIVDVEQRRESNRDYKGERRTHVTALVLERDGRRKRLYASTIETDFGEYWHEYYTGVMDEV